jgi:hypothetical protein
VRYLKHYRAIRKIAEGLNVKGQGSPVFEMDTAQYAAEGYLHEMCHFMTLGTKSVSSAVRALHHYHQDLNECASLAMEMIVSRAIRLNVPPDVVPVARQFGSLNLSKESWRKRVELFEQDIAVIQMADELINSIKYLMEGDMDVDEYGLGNGNPPDARQVETCKKWIEENATKRKSINKDRSSYGLKHDVENATGEYVSNGAFIRAMIDLGYTAKPVGVGSPNANFNIGLSRKKTQR